MRIAVFAGRRQPSRAKLCILLLPMQAEHKPAICRAHPYHESCAHRCADLCFCRSLPTVEHQVMCSSRTAS
jgi:hypothetical protein